MDTGKILASVLALAVVFGSAEGFTVNAAGSQAEETVIRKEISNMIIPVEEVDITVTAPKGGENPDFNAVTYSKGAEIVGQARWLLGNNPLEEGSTYSAGKVYFVQIAVKPLDGYMLNDDVKVLINGRQAYEPLDGGSVRVFSVSFTAENAGNNSSSAEDSSSSRTDNSSSLKDNSSSKADNSSSKVDNSSSADKPRLKLGDVNGDKKIDIEDAVMVINHVNGQKALTNEQYKRANVDGNSKVDIVDAVAIIGHVNGVKAIM